MGNVCFGSMTSGKEYPLARVGTDSYHTLDVPNVQFNNCTKGYRVIVPVRELSPPVDIDLCKQIEARTRENCCKVIEDVTGLPFERNRAIHDSLGGFVKVDCYNSDLKVALDYLGYQGMDSTSNNRKKLERCKHLGVKLITIPPLIAGDPPSIRSFIARRIPNRVR